MEIEAKKRLEEIRKSIQAENVSYGELAELQSLVDFIDGDDVELLEWTGVPEDRYGRAVWEINSIADRIYYYGEDITPKEAQKIASDLWHITDGLNNYLE